jgi:uncharacterized membrane protein
LKVTTLCTIYSRGRLALGVPAFAAAIAIYRLMIAKPFAMT